MTKILVDIEHDLELDLRTLQYQNTQFLDMLTNCMVDSHSKFDHTNNNNKYLENLLNCMYEIDRVKQKLACVFEKAQKLIMTRFLPEESCD